MKNKKGKKNKKAIIALVLAVALCGSVYLAQAAISGFSNFGGLAAVLGASSAPVVLNGSADPGSIAIGSNLDVSWTPADLGEATSAKVFTCYYGISNPGLQFNSNRCKFLSGVVDNNGTFSRVYTDTMVPTPTNCLLSSKAWFVGIMRADTGQVKLMSKPFSLTGKMSNNACSPILISLNPTSPVSGIVVSNQGAVGNEVDKLPLLSFNVKSIDSGNLKINNIALSLKKTGNGSAIASSAYLYDGANMIGSVNVSNETVSFSNLDYVVPSNTTKTLTLKVYVRNVNNLGTTFTSSVKGSEVSVQDGAGVSIYPYGSANGGAITVINNSVTPQMTLLNTETSVSAGSSANDDMGTFKIRFAVRAEGGPIFVPSLVKAATGISDYSGNTVVIVDRAGTATKGGVSVALSNLSDPTLTGAGNYKIDDGQTRTFELTVTARLPVVGNAGMYRASLGGLAWSSTDISPVANLYTTNLDPFKTAYIGLN